MERKNESIPRADLFLVLIMLMGAFVAVLNETFLNVSLGRLTEALEISTSTAQWLVSGFPLVIGIFIPASAFFVQRFTTRQLFLTAMALFSFGTLLCGIAPGFAFLMVGRVVQAAATALLIPLLTNVILALIPASQRGTAMGTLGIVISVAPAVGPTVSGWILSFAPWRALFFGVLPISLAVLVFSYFTVRNVTDQTNPKLDPLSFGLSAFGFGGLVFAASRGGESGIANPGVLAAAGIGAVALSLFVWRQLRLKEPMLELRTLRYRMFTLSLLIVFGAMMSLFAALIILPLYLQNVQGVSPLEAGLMLLPGGLILAAMSPITGRLFDRYGGRPLAVPGFAVISAALFGMATLGADSPLYLVVTLHSIFMLGISTVLMPALTNGLNQLPRRLYSHGTAIANTAQQVGAAFGTALLVAVLSYGTQAYITDSGAGGQLGAVNFGTTLAFATSATVAAIGLVLCLFMRHATPEDEDEPVPETA